MRAFFASIAKNVIPLFVLAYAVNFVCTSVFPRPDDPGRRVERRKPKKVRAARKPIEFWQVKKPVADLNASMRKYWSDHNVLPSPQADRLQILRRLSLALTGTIPSIEELRWFESQPDKSAYLAYINYLLDDPRVAAYLAERWARVTVGSTGGAFIVFRRRRFVSWLEEQFQKNQPFDQVVTSMVAGKGLWTDKPATNFITRAYDDNIKRLREIQLAGTVSKAFLGIRMDCAECHDHPFEDWSRKDFHGLAGYFGQAEFSVRGVTYNEKKSYVRLEIDGSSGPKIKARVPFQKQLLSSTGTQREQLAGWLTHKSNRYFSRAVVNRFWALLFGRALVEPIDELPKGGPFPAPLNVLAKDFGENGFNIRRLITVITLSRAFQLESTVPETEATTVNSTQQPLESSNSDSNDTKSSSREDWGANDEVEELTEPVFQRFPLTQLRPEQMIGSVIQSTSLSTIDRQSFWLARFMRITQENDFLKRYGDHGEDRFESGAGTIPQRLLLMNGKIVKERIKPELFSLVGQLDILCDNSDQSLECLYLAVLTRRPSKEERDYFLPLLNVQNKDERLKVLADIHWSLINCTESSWNH